MKKININLNDEDNSYVLTQGSNSSPSIPNIPEVQEIQDNYFIINAENSVSLPQINLTESCAVSQCSIVESGSPSANVTYAEMVNYVTQRLINYIIISPNPPSNPPEGQLWIQI